MMNYLSFKVNSHSIRNLYFLFFFILVITVSQIVILRPHLEFGFSPDDIWSFSDFASFGPNPFPQFPHLYKTLGPHFINPIFYNGILFSLFKFNFLSYQIIALIFKILSVISFFILIQTVFKNRFLSFMSGLIYSFHYGSVGSFEMVARTQDYLVISGLNTFLILFYLISIRKLKNFVWLIICSLTLFLSFFINPIRAYPILPFIIFLSILLFIIKDRTLRNFYQIIKNIIIIFFPFILFISVLRGGEPFYKTTFSIIQKTYVGNFQMLLSPFSSFGSLFVFGDILKPISLPFWRLDNFLPFFIQGPLLIFGVTTLLISGIVARKPLKFFLSVTAVNFFLELLVFLAIEHGLSLAPGKQIIYDSHTFAPPAILGIYVLTVTIFIFIEWLHQKNNIYLSLYILGMSFAATFIWFTWIFQDIASIPLGIYGYATIPSMGISASLGSLLVMAYVKLKSQSGFIQSIAPIVFLVPTLYFFFSFNRIQIYLSENIIKGNNAKDQSYLTSKFWQSIDKDHPCNKLIYLSMNDYPNGYYYAFIMIDRFDKWYSLYSPYHSSKPCPVQLLVNDEAKLSKSFVVREERKGFIYTANNQNLFIPIEDFYAFELHDRDITNITNDIIKKLQD